MNHSDNIGEIATALAKAQAELASGVKKGSQNPQLRNAYAGLPEVLHTALPVLSKHGLSIVQGLMSFRQDPRAGEFGEGVEPAEGPPGTFLTTRLYHTSGQWIDCGALAMPKLDPNRGTNIAQMLGSAITYCRRYTVMAAVGLSPVDDDGNDAGPPGGKHNTADSYQERAKQQASQRSTELAVPSERVSAWCDEIELAASQEDLQVTLAAVASVKDKLATSQSARLRAAAQRKMASFKTTSLPSTQEMF